MPKSIHGKNLSDKHHRMWRKVYDSMKSRGHSDEEAGAAATSQVKKNLRKKAHEIVVTRALIKKALTTSIDPPAIASKKPDNQTRETLVDRLVQDRDKAEAKKDEAPVQPGVVDQPIATGDNRVYTVHQGESLMDIAQKIYGDTEKWQIIAQANNLKSPNQLEPGTQLVIPGQGQEERQISSDHQKMAYINLMMKKARDYLARQEAR